METVEESLSLQQQHDQPHHVQQQTTAVQGQQHKQQSEPPLTGGPATSTPGTSLLEQLCAARATERAFNEAAFRDQSQQQQQQAQQLWPQSFPARSSATVLAYRPTGSATLTSLMTRPAWLPQFDTPPSGHHSEGAAR